MAHGEYCAAGGAFLQLAKAYAAVRHGPGDEDAGFQAVLRLLEGSSLDLRTAHRARAGIEEQEALVQMTEAFHMPLLKYPAPDLVGYFETVTRLPLIDACSFTEVYDLARGTEKLDLLADDFATVGLDPNSVGKMEPSAVRRVIEGKLVPRRWRFMNSLEPRGVMIAQSEMPLDPREFVLGGPVEEDLPWSIPRLQIGWAYWPGIAPCIDLDLRLEDLRRLEWETGFDALRAALAAALGCDLELSIMARA